MTPLGIPVVKVGILRSSRFFRPQKILADGSFELTGASALVGAGSRVTLSLVLRRDARRRLILVCYCEYAACGPVYALVPKSGLALDKVQGDAGCII